MENQKYLYRVESLSYIFNKGLPFEVNKMKVLQETEHSFLLQRSEFLHEKMFAKRMFKNANNRYAFETKKEAMENYIKRKNYHIKCLKSNLNEAEYQLKKAMESEVLNG
jgi:hypothetical protein